MKCECLRLDEAMYTCWVWSIASRTQSRRRRQCRRSHSSSFNPSFLPIPAIVGYKPVSGGLACRATPRRDETNWEIMPLNAAGRPDPITLVFSNTSPAGVHSLSFYFTYRRLLQPAARRVSIIQTILTAKERWLSAWVSTTCPVLLQHHL